MSRKRKAKDEPDASPSAEKKHKAGDANEDDNGGKTKPALITITCGAHKAVVNLEMLRMFCKHPLLSTDGIGVKPLEDGGILPLDNKTFPFVTAASLRAFADVMQDPFRITKELADVTIDVKMTVFLICDYLEAMPSLCSAVMDAATLTKVTFTGGDDHGLQAWAEITSRFSAADRKQKNDHLRGYAFSLGVLSMYFTAGNPTVSKPDEIPAYLDDKRLLWDKTRAQSLIKHGDGNSWDINYNGIMEVLLIKKRDA